MKEQKDHAIQSKKDKEAKKPKLWVKNIGPINESNYAASIIVISVAYRFFGLLTSEVNF